MNTKVAIICGILIFSGLALVNMNYNYLGLILMIVGFALGSKIRK